MAAVTAAPPVQATTPAAIAVSTPVTPAVPVNVAPEQAAVVAQVAPQSAVPPSATPPQPAATNAVTPDLAAALAALIPPEVRADPAKLQMYVQVLQNLHTMGIPPQQWAPVLQALNTQQATVNQATAPPPPPTQSVPAQAAQNDQVVNTMHTQPAAPTYTQPMPTLAQTGVDHGRSRSRSPIQRRGSPVYDTYTGSNEYRQRSPLRGDGLSGQEDMIPLVEKWTEMDPSLPANSIKVLSRTLFVGGVS